MSLLDIRGLTLATGGTTLVSDVSFSIAPGERLGLIGESGSGKSLTALAAIGLLPGGFKIQGSIKLDGQEMVGASESAMIPLRGAAAATVFQEPLTALNPLMKVGKQVAEPVFRRHRRAGEAVDRAAAAREVRSLLERVSLPDIDRIVKSYPYEISGGQRQRVAIAMALACRPKLLVADEPTTALDVTTQVEILDLLSGLVREEGMALLFISHDLPVVARVTENVVVLRRGEVIERGEVHAVFDEPKHKYTRSLVDAANAFDKALGPAR
ncbi:ATP-binding cassette domain-containing protein [Nitratireductor kimnyeongensis]|uniref:ATP-binding cassette domain-containing protein n=1 Tax=Nitratireductor kimnyeongensis TaxID=430679 RepID=A0ABW0TC71_9HYPH|nr:ABC transporter ATP-binding protein [Nitratireductor kimnyeongensis]QZZ37698.1 ABC transporter ATP-binding protein [Nitratireductor kimnyeongensis]